MIIDLHEAGLLTQLLAKGLHVFQVFFAQALRIDQQLVAGDLKIAKLRPLLKRKLQLFRSEDVKQQDFVALVAKMANGVQQRANLIEAIGENDDQAAAFYLPGQTVPE